MNKQQFIWFLFIFFSNAAWSYVFYRLYGRVQRLKHLPYHLVRSAFMEGRESCSGTDRHRGDQAWENSRAKRRLLTDETK